MWPHLANHVDGILLSITVFLYRSSIMEGSLANLFLILIVMCTCNIIIIITVRLVLPIIIVIIV